MRKKGQIIIWLCGTVVLVLVVGICYFFQEKNVFSNSKIQIHNEGYQKTVSLFLQDGKYYAFLPSWADLNSTYITNPAVTIYINNQLFDETTSFADLEEGKEYPVIIKNSIGLTVSNERLIILRSAKIPTMFITLSDSIPDDLDSSKNVKKSGSLMIMNEEGEENYSGPFKSIHGRGKASWSSPKKPYSLEFNTDVNVLGMGAAKKWILLSNAYDASNLKNKMVFQASQILGMRYSCDSRFIDLYINNEYRGLYLLTEKVEIGKNRVDIYDMEQETQKENYKKLSSYPKVESNILSNGCKNVRYYDIPNNPEDITGGYIIKNESLDRVDEDSMFATIQGNGYDCESPKYATKEQIEYISTLLEQMEQAAETGNYQKLSEIIDIDSFVNRYLIEECFANYEMSSLYYIKDSDTIDSKIYFEPVWDYDAAWGATKTKEPTGIYNMNGIFRDIIENNPQIRKSIVQVYYTRMLPILENCPSMITEFGNSIKASDEMNKIRWKTIFGENNSLDSKLNELISFTTQRRVFLSEYLNQPEEFATVSFSDPERITGGFFYSKTIRKGETIEKIEDLKDNDYDFLGWYDKDSGKSFESDEPIYSDIHYQAKWEPVHKNVSFFSKDGIKKLLKPLVKDLQKNPDIYVAYGSTVILLCALLILFLKSLQKKRSG